MAQVTLLSGTEWVHTQRAAERGTLKEGWEDQAVLIKICKHRIWPYVDCMLGAM